MCSIGKRKMIKEQVVTGAKVDNLVNYNYVFF